MRNRVHLSVLGSTLSLLLVLSVAAIGSPVAEAPVADADFLVAQAAQMHFDAALGFVVERVMFEGVTIEFGAELAAHAAQQIQIERSRVSGRVVIGGVQPLRILAPFSSRPQPP